MGRFAVTSLHADGLASRHELTLVQLAPNRCSRPVAGLNPSYSSGIGVRCVLG